MSLKDLIKDSHDRAEQTAFMRSIFAGTLSLDKWADFVYQKSLFYSTIETQAKSVGLFDDLPGIERAELLAQDYNEMATTVCTPKETTKDYMTYLRGLTTADDIMAHVYTWHMGDLFGGQMIKRVVSAPHRALDFNNADLLKTNIRVKLKDTMSTEANCAFEWAIKLLEEYDESK